MPPTPIAVAAAHSDVAVRAKGPPEVAWGTLPAATWRTADYGCNADAAGRHAQTGDGYLTWRWVDNDGPDFGRCRADCRRRSGGDRRRVTTDAVPDRCRASPLPTASAGALARPSGTPESTARLPASWATSCCLTRLLATLCDADAPTGPDQPAPADPGPVGDAVSTTLPASSAQPRRPCAGVTVTTRAQSRHPPDHPGPVVVVGPMVPGQSATSPLGSACWAAEQRLTHWLPPFRLGCGASGRGRVSRSGRRTDVDRDWLRHRLGKRRAISTSDMSPRRRSAGESVDAALHAYCCQPLRGSAAATEPPTCCRRLPPAAHRVDRLQLRRRPAPPDAMGLSAGGVEYQRRKLVTASDAVGGTHQSRTGRRRRQAGQPPTAGGLITSPSTSTSAASIPIPTCGALTAQQRARCYAEGRGRQPLLLGGAHHHRWLMRLVIGRQMPRRFAFGSPQGRLQSEPQVASHAKTITTTVVAGISALGLIGALGSDARRTTAQRLGGEAASPSTANPLDLGSRTVACTTHDGRSSSPSATTAGTPASAPP